MSVELGRDNLPRTHDAVVAVDRDAQRSFEFGSSSRFLNLGLIALLGAAAIVHLVLVLSMRFELGGRSTFTLVDDAMISMRYAENLSGGQGLVWNVGEDAVQGFTNLGYTLVLAVAHWSGLSSTMVSLVAVSLTTAALMLTSWTAAWLVRLLLPMSVWAPFVAAAAVAFNFGLVFWSARGMEVSLVAAGVTLAALCGLVWLRDRRSRMLVFAGFGAAFAVLVRIDSLAPSLVVFGLLAVFVYRERRRDAVLALGASAIPIGVALSVVLFQLVYFGDPLPNTYYLKTDGVGIVERVSVGWEAFVGNALDEIVILMVMSLIGLVFVRPSRRSAQGILLLGSVAVISMLYSVWVGGDYAEPQVHAPNRFILVGLPSLIVVAVVCMDGLRRRVSGPGSSLRGVTSISVLVVTLILILSPNFANWSDMARGAVPLLSADQRRASLGAHLASTLPHDAVIAVHAAGQIPYYSGLAAIDLLGKSDSHIAHIEQTSQRFRSGHNKWDYAYSIGQLRPDVIADEWGSVSQYLSGTGGYSRLPNGIWVSDFPSVSLDVEAIGACYWNCG